MVIVIVTVSLFLYPKLYLYEIHGKQTAHLEAYCADYFKRLLKTVDIRSPKTVISVHFSYSLPMAMQIY